MNNKYETREQWLDVGTPICTFQEHGPMEVAD